MARILFERAVIERVELEYMQPDSDLTISRAALFDASTGKADPLSKFSLPRQRWQRTANFGTIELYENRQALPRAWFVKHVAVLPEAQVLQVIREGKLPGGDAFRPRACCYCLAAWL